MSCNELQWRDCSVWQQLSSVCGRGRRETWRRNLAQRFHRRGSQILLEGRDEEPASYCEARVSGLSRFCTAFRAAEGAEARHTVFIGRAMTWAAADGLGQQIVGALGTRTISHPGIRAGVCAALCSPPRPPATTPSRTDATHKLASTCASAFMFSIGHFFLCLRRKMPSFVDRVCRFPLLPPGNGSLCLSGVCEKRQAGHAGGGRN